MAVTSDSIVEHLDVFEDVGLGEIAKSVPPQLEGRSHDPEVSAGFVDVPDLLRVLHDSLLSPNFSLIVGHSDPLGHLVP